MNIEETIINRIRHYFEAVKDEDFVDYKLTLTLINSSNKQLIFTDERGMF